MRRRRTRSIAPVYAVSVLVAALLTAGVTYLLVSQLSLNRPAAYFLAISTTTLLAYSYDKSIAGGTRSRVPELVLHALALAGGTPAALLGQAMFRHKTQKRSFRTAFWTIAILQAIALGAWAWLRRGA